MSYKTILVGVDIDNPPDTLLEFAVDLASRCGARLVGFSAAEARFPYAGPEGAAIAAEVWVEEEEQIQRQLDHLGHRWKTGAGGKVEVDWRARIGNPTRSLAEVARIADLVVTVAPNGADTGDPYRVVDPGSLVLQAGRPVLIGPSLSTRLRTDEVLIGWKDTRESRRAVADAVPLLALAGRVTIVTVDREPGEETRASLRDVADFLRHHGIEARTEVLAAEDEVNGLCNYVAESRPDFLVSGAWGHSRLREWAFGGVTRALLDYAELSRFMSN
jgi:nucleotide-binding universal stress UspA family protein